ncbi:MAG: hypothetical protein ACRCXZ_06740 [Patescibacteria group bacterium]
MSTLSNTLLCTISNKLAACLTAVALSTAAVGLVTAPAQAAVYEECGVVSAYSPDDSTLYTAQSRNVWDVYNEVGYFVAHPWLPFGTSVYSSKGTFLGVVMDRGPYTGGRILDLWYTNGDAAYEWGTPSMCIRAEY